MGNEVLEDDLLDVPVFRVDGGDRLQGTDPLLLALPDPDQDPGGEGDSQIPRQPDRLQPPRRVLRRGALVHDQVGVDRLEHQALRRGHLADALQVLTREHPEVGVGQQPTLDAPLARPDDVGGEVVVAPVAQSRRDLRVHLRSLAGEHEQLLGVAAHRLVQSALNLIRVVDVRPVRGEGAVLAVALTRPRQRERVIAREGDPAHRRENLAEWRYVPCVPTSPRCRRAAARAGAPDGAVAPLRQAARGRAARPYPQAPAPGRWTAR